MEEGEGKGIGSIGVVAGIKPREEEGARKEEEGGRKEIRRKRRGRGRCRREETQTLCSRFCQSNFRRRKEQGGEGRRREEKGGEERRREEKRGEKRRREEKRGEVKVFTKPS
jgi:hypothetical protein